jgi:hypothetical protein
MSKEHLPVDEFEPNGPRLHNVSGHVWEGYSDWIHPSFQRRTAAQVEAVDLWARRVRGRITVGAAIPLSIPIPRSNLGGRSPPGPSLDNHIVLMYPNGEEDTNGDAIGTEVQRPLRSR